MGRRYTQDQVKNIFANGGCELLSTYYTSGEPVQYRCSCGNISYILINNLLKGQRCKICAHQKSDQKRTFSQEYVAQYFKDRGCELLATYINSHTQVKYRCSCGNISQIRFYDFQGGCRCKVCGNLRHSKKFTGSGNPNWNTDREQVKLNRELIQLQHNLLHSCLNRLGTKKEGHIDIILGYTPLELDTHLRSFPMYAYLIETNTLSIDHILPIQAFKDHNIRDPKIICALTNLQPLSRRENFEKHDWYVEDQFLAYCKKHGITVERKQGSERQTLLKEVM